VVATACPAVVPGAGQVRPGVADIFRRFGPAYLDRELLPPQVSKVLRNIIRCRTAALGGHASVCEVCHEKWLHYNSCFDRHCPTCQGPLAAVWTSQCLERLIETPHFHTVTTCPDELHPLALANQAIVYDLLLRATSESLLQLAASRWKALPAITAVLHTWNRQMGYHPHVHCVITGGGLSFDGDRWVPCKKSDYLFPVKVLSKLVRGKFMDGLRRAYEDGRLRFVGTSAHLADPSEFQRLVDQLYTTSWYSYTKPTFGKVEDILRYLSLYTHRVAISSSRILSVDADAIVFLTKDGETCRLHPDEFLRRFLLHVLPKGFRKIRYYGLSAPSNVNTRLPVAQRLAEAMNRRHRRAHSVQPPASASPRPTRPQPGDRCPACGVGILVKRPLPLARAPPVLP